MAKKFFIETFGCQMNELDSEKIAGSLSHDGMEPVAEAGNADVIILNTCSVREKAVQKVYARLGEIKRHKARRNDVVVGVVGCMAQLEGESILKRSPFVSVLAGPQKSHVIPGLVAETSATGRPVIDLRMEEDPEPLETSHVLRESSWRAGVTISEGCNRMCSFCVVPFTRGKERNRESQNIVREVRELVAQGYMEIVLLGQTVNSYRDPSDREITFARLLRKLAEIEGLRRIRFTSPHPNDFSEELLEVMTAYPQVCNHVHMPVQSGSTRILRSMRRGYSRARYLETIHKLQAASRPIAISTDIIVGFPGETEEDFQHTISLIDEVQYDSIFSFKYSPRPNTAALDMDDEIAEEEKGRRLRFLQERQKLIQYNKNASYMGKEVEILVDDKARARFLLSGRTSSNKIVNFDGPELLLGRFIRVEVTGFSANSLKGKWKDQRVEEP
jgi:tRNA-2-methylthio-N6-dimethylallyladenosine synthase